MKNEKGNAVRKARVVALTDEEMKEAGSIDFSRRQGKKEADEKDLETIASALAEAKAWDDDSLFFACLDAARELGAETSTAGRKTSSLNWQGSPAKAARNVFGFVDLTEEGSRPFRADGATAFVNASTKRVALLARGEGGAHDGHVLAPGEACAIVDGRVLGREPAVKGGMVDGWLTFPTPYAYPVEWTDPADGSAVTASETSFAKTKARVPDEAEFPLTFAAPRSKRLMDEAEKAGDGRPETQARVLGGVTYEKTWKSLEEEWRKAKDDVKHRGIRYVRAERARVVTAKKAARSGRTLVAAVADERRKKEAEEKAKKPWDGAVYHDGASWERASAPAYVVRAESDWRSSKKRIEMDVVFMDDEEILETCDRRSLKWAAFPVTERETALAAAKAWAEEFRVSEHEVWVEARPRAADPAYARVPSTTKTHGLDEAAAEALRLDGLDALEAASVASWARRSGGARFGTYDSLSALERAWLAEGRDAKSLIAAVANGEVSLSPSGAARAAFGSRDAS